MGYEITIIISIVFCVVTFVWIVASLYKIFRAKNEVSLWWRLAKILGPTLYCFFYYLAILCYGKSISTDKNLYISDILNLGEAIVESTKFKLQPDIISLVTGGASYNGSTPLFAIDRLNIPTKFWVELSKVATAGYIIVIIVFLAGVIGIIVKIAKNIFRRFTYLLCGCDILLGYNDVETYLNGSKSSKGRKIIVWLKEPNENEERNLSSLGIPYYNRSFTSEMLTKVLKNKLFRILNRKYNFICLGDEAYALHCTTEFKKFLNGKRIKKLKTKDLYNLYIEVDYENLESIRNKMALDNDFASFIHVINRYELISFDFNEKHPISKYLPSYFYSEKDGIRTGLLEKNKNINVIYVGYGRVCKAINDISVVNDIIPTFTDKMRVEQIKYYAFDDQKFRKHVDSNGGISIDYEDENPIHYKSRFNSFSKNCIMDKHKYYDFPEDIAFPEKKDNNIYYEQSFNELKDMLEYRETVYNRIVISFSDDISNINFAIKLVSYLKQNGIYKNVHIFVRVKEYDEETYNTLCDDRVTVFGCERDIINHDVIINEELYDMAKALHNQYESVKKNKLKWFYKDIHKQNSNLYLALNMRVKLNLLGFDYYKSNDNSVKYNESFIEFNNKFERILKIADNLNESVNKLKKSKFLNIPYDVTEYYGKGDLFNGYINYLDTYKVIKNCVNNSIINGQIIYSEPYVENILAFQEHSRWNAFHIKSGFVPYPKDELKVVLPTELTFKKDDITELKKHICLADFYALDQYHLDSTKSLLESEAIDYDELIERLYAIKSFSKILKGSEEHYIIKINLYPNKVEQINKFKKVISSSFLDYCLDKNVDETTRDDKFIRVIRKKDGKDIDAAREHINSILSPWSEKYVVLVDDKSCLSYQDLSIDTIVIEAPDLAKNLCEYLSLNKRYVECDKDHTLLEEYKRILSDNPYILTLYNIEYIYNNAINNPKNYVYIPIEEKIRNIKDNQYTSGNSGKKDSLYLANLLYSLKNYSMRKYLQFTNLGSDNSEKYQTLYDNSNNLINLLDLVLQEPKKKLKKEKKNKKKNNSKSNIVLNSDKLDFIEKKFGVVLSVNKLKKSWSEKYKLNKKNSILKEVIDKAKEISDQLEALNQKEFEEQNTTNEKYSSLTFFNDDTATILEKNLIKKSNNNLVEIKKMIISDLVTFKEKIITLEFACFACYYNNSINEAIFKGKRISSLQNSTNDVKEIISEVERLINVIMSNEKGNLTEDASKLEEAIKAYIAFQANVAIVNSNNELELNSNVNNAIIDAINHTYDDKFIEEFTKDLHFLMLETYKYDYDFFGYVNKLLKTDHRLVKL